MLKENIDFSKRESQGGLTKRRVDTRSDKNKLIGVKGACVGRKSTDKNQGLGKKQKGDRLELGLVWLD